MKNKVWRLFPLTLFIILALFLWRGLSLDPQALTSVHSGHPVPSFKLPQLESEEALLDSESLRGRISLLNVWASWCRSCEEEQIFLMKLNQQGIPVFGINYKDERQSALRWLKEWGNPYQRIGQDKTGKTAIDLGVYGVPETFLLDAKGIIRFRHAGVLDNAVWKREFLPRIQQLRAGV